MTCFAKRRLAAHSPLRQLSGCGDAQAPDVTAEALNLPQEEMLRWFGQEAIPFLAELYPDFFQAHCTTQPFILSLNNIIHPEVSKDYPSAALPMPDFSDGANGSLLEGCQFSRKLCTLAQGFVEGTAAYYCETVMISHVKCMHQDDAKCLFQIRFLPY